MLIAQVLTEVNNRVQSLLLYYLAALFRSHGSGDLTVAYYQLRELEYIHFTESKMLSKKVTDMFLREVAITRYYLLDEFLYGYKFHVSN